MIRAAVFDLDGTLVDTLADLATASNRVLMRLGLPAHPIDSYRTFVGDGVRALCQRASPDGISGALLALYEHLYSWEMPRRGYDLTRVFPGIEALLDKLSSKGLKLAVLTNKPHGPAEKMINHYFEGRFDQIYGVRPGVPKKPDPEALFEVARGLGVAAEEILYFGDTDTDMLTSSRAGAVSVGVTWGFRPAEELLEAGADVLLDHPMDIDKVEALAIASK